MTNRSTDRTVRRPGAQIQRDQAVGGFPSEAWNITDNGDGTFKLTLKDNWTLDGDIDVDIPSPESVPISRLETIWEGTPASSVDFSADPLEDGIYFVTVQNWTTSNTASMMFLLLIDNNADTHNYTTTYTAAGTGTNYITLRYVLSTKVLERVSSGYGGNITKLEKFVQEDIITVYRGEKGDPGTSPEYEYYANNGGAINTDYDSSYTIESENGTPLLAMTASSHKYKDVLIPTLESNDTIVLQVRSNLDGLWIDADKAGVQSLTIKSLFGNDHFYNSGNGYMYTRAMYITHPLAYTFRIYFPSTIDGVTFGDSGVHTSRTWAQIIAASDGYDNWRIKVTKA